MDIKIFIDMLTQDSVSIRKQNYTTINDVEYLIGDPWRKAYVNSMEGRKELKTEVSEPYYSAIMAMWGDAATAITTNV